MILEGIVTTLNADGTVNVSPMGPLVDEAMERLVLRPYPTSTTFANLQRTGAGVLHVTDDVELLARAAVGQLLETPELIEVAGVATPVLAAACRWYAFEIESIDASRTPHRVECRVVDQGRLRDFFGFNRAKHAVIEAAILATRIEFLPAEDILAELARLQAPVEKTGGPSEERAFAFLQQYVDEAVAAARSVT